MATPPNNPFVLPGFGQTGDLAQNPVLASMEMMRQAWQNLAGPGSLDASLMTAAVSPEELEKRINDLRAVENWLRLNLSMLSSTIQGMEVQRATLSTLRSFVASANNPFGTPPAAAPAEPAKPAKAGTDAGAKPSAGGSAEPAKKSPEEPSGQSDDATLAAAAAAAQGWWDMLQKQFDTLAAATTATLQGADALKTAAQSAPAPATQADKPAAAKSRTPRKAAGKTATGKPTARKTTRRTPPNH